MARRDLRDATITFRDGTTPTPISTEVLIGTGNVTWTENTPMEYETEKGKIATGSVRKADEVPVELSITAKWVDVTTENAEPISPYELAYAQGAASAAVTTGNDDCEPYAFEIEIAFVPECATKHAERVIFAEVRAESVTFDAQAGTLAITAKSREVRPTYDRPDPPSNSVAPSVSTDGTPVSGEVVSRTAGTWANGTQSAIQWYRADDNTGTNEVAIAGATANNYTLVAGDVGKYVSFKLTYSNAYGSTTVQSDRVNIPS